MNWFCKQRGITELKLQDLEGPTYEIVKVFHLDVIHLQYQMEECNKLLNDSVDDPILRHNVSKPLPLEGPPGQVTIQSNIFFNKDLEYLRYSSKGRRPALSISKMKAAYYPDAGLEQMVPDQFWIEEECKYDIAAMYGISHWWFQIQRFYIDRHTSEGDRSTVRTHMRILSVVRIEVFSMYGYDYMKKIVLCRADLNEHVIAERDFNDFEDLNLLKLQGHLNHLPPKDKKILTTAVNQWTRQLVIRQRVEDFQLRIVSYQTQMMMRFNEIHKFSDGTLQQIIEALDYRVKEFRINRINTGLNTRKDVDRCNAFMFVIQWCLRTRRIFRNLESFVGGRSFTRFYRLSHSELVDIEKVAVCSILRSPKSKCTIESRAKRSSKIISLGHYSILLASSYTVKSKAYFKSPTHYPCVKMEILLEPIANKLLVEHLSDTYVFTMKMEILLDPSSNKLLVGTTISTVVHVNIPKITLDVVIDDVAILIHDVPWVVDVVAYLSDDVLPPHLLARPTFRPPLGVAVCQPALRVIILGDIIYAREDI
nr:hypothetical protein [Tanacetum cinerariifolium]